MDPETEPFTDYCDWAVANVRERLRGNDADAIVRLRGDIQTAAKGGANARRGLLLPRGTAEVGGSFADIDKIIERTFKALEREIVQCLRRRHGVPGCCGGLFHKLPAARLPTLVLATAHPSNGSDVRNNKLELHTNLE